MIKFMYKRNVLNYKFVWCICNILLNPSLNSDVNDFTSQSSVGLYPMNRFLFPRQMYQTDP